MSDDMRLDVLLALADETGLSIDALERQSRGMDAQELARWAGSVSSRSRYRKSSVTP